MAETFFFCWVCPSISAILKVSNEYIIAATIDYLKNIFIGHVDAMTHFDKMYIYIYIFFMNSKAKRN